MYNSFGEENFVLFFAISVIWHFLNDLDEGQLCYREISNRRVNRFALASMAMRTEDARAAAARNVSLGAFVQHKQEQATKQMAALWSRTEQFAERCERRYLRSPHRSLVSLNAN